MKMLKFAIVICFAAALALLLNYSRPVAGQGAPQEAPAGFDNLTNGVSSQTTFDEDLDVFAEQETIEDGLGPVYNATSCGECHQNPVVGGISQITELRAGHFNGINFVDHPGGSLINDRAIEPGLQERVLGAQEVRSFRTSLNLLGDGFVEAIDSNTLIAIYNSQPAGLRALAVQVPVLESPGSVRLGRFGWKNQHASLISFSADAYLNEMGITSPLQPTENSSNGTSVARFDTVADPEDDGEDIEIFARFMRATKVPPRDTVLAATADSVAGSQIFDAIGCNICHVRNITTAPAGTVINGGEFIVPAALGNKVIHPFSDFGLHDVGTGDGIVQGVAATRNRVRTPPLWGMRTRNRLMHNGAFLTRNEAILGHFGEANPVINNYINLSDLNKNRLITFLNSL